jgi:CelD/BcsL family acetyltransferase involved in cellulose biosynthesis
MISIPESRPAPLSSNESGLRERPVVKGLRLTWHRRHTFPEALAKWRELEARLQWRAVTSSTRWTETWLKHYGDQLSPEIVIAEEAGIVRGALLVVTSERQFEGPIRLRTVHLGTAGETDTDSVIVEYNTICADEASRIPFLNEVVATLAQRQTWDELRLDGFTERDLSPVLEHHPQFTLRRRPCYHTQFVATDSAASVIEQLTAQARRAIRRNLRMYEGATTEWATTVDHAHAVFDDLIRLHQARWIAEGKPGAYASEQFTQFHRELLEELVPAGRAVFVRIRKGEEVIGCSHLLIDRGRGLLYQSGHAPHESQRSPGLLTDWLTLMACKEQGLEAFDFMAGETYHKRRLTLHTDELVWARWIRPSWKRIVIDRLRDFKRLSQNWWAQCRTNQCRTDSGSAEASPKAEVDENNAADTPAATSTPRASE